MSSKLTELVLRPNEGKLGRTTRVRTNSYQITTFPVQSIYHYDIDVDPVILQAKKQALWKAFEETRGIDVCSGAKSIFDGHRNVLSVKKINLGEQQAQQFKVKQTNNFYYHCLKLNKASSWI
jgi:hypothetical protein